jgi:hypothetical protein
MIAPMEQIVQTALITIVALGAGTVFALMGVAGQR